VPQGGPTGAPDGIQFVDEDDARGLGLDSTHKKIANMNSEDVKKNDAVMLIMRNTSSGVTRQKSICFPKICSLSNYI
jgi:hypothetical protein